MSNGLISNRMIALMRLILASSASLIVFLDRSLYESTTSATYITLVFYTVYCGAIYVFEIWRRPLVPSFITHWVDIGWYTALIALSSGTNSILFFGFFFSILVASFQLGFAAGLRVVIVSAILFAIIGFTATPATDPKLELYRFLLRPIFLLVLGYMIAYWGGREMTLKRRLALLKELNTISNPRFGIDRTFGSIMEQLRAFYSADACLLVMAEPGTSEYSLRRTDRYDPERAMRSEPITAEAAQQLLTLPDECAVVYRSEASGWWRPRGSCYSYNTAKAERMGQDQERVEALAAVLDSNSFVTVPMHRRSETIGRLYLTARKRAFDDSDADFLLQVVEHVMPIIENIRLVDQLASEAAEQERQRIARDIHDSVIQPYIGLQLGLGAVRQKLTMGSSDVTGDIERLIKLTDVEIDDLRRYMRGLKDASSRGGSLLPAVRRFAAKFTEAAGVAVRVEAAADVRVNDRLAAEAFQIVAEGLSNIRRHTKATRAVVELACRNSYLTLRIENDNENGSVAAPFVPRSIKERASALGGRAQVKRHENGDTVISVEIPL